MVMAAVMTAEKANKRVSNVVLFVLCTTLIGLFFINGTAAREPSSADPGEFIKALAQSAIAVLGNPGSTLKERRKKLRVLLIENFAMKQIGRFVVGRYWREMSSQQREKFRNLFEDWIVRYYTIRLNRYSGQTLQVIHAKNAGLDDVVVSSRIEGTQSSSPLKVNWRIRQFAAGPKIIDVIVEGVSMSVVQRADFLAIIRQRGVDGFLEQLNTRLSELENRN